MDYQVPIMFDVFFDSQTLTFPLLCVPRAGLGKPWSASNANKPASSWLLKQDPKN